LFVLLHDAIFRVLQEEREIERLMEASPDPYPGDDALPL
jgi:hypothetical protein